MAETLTHNQTFDSPQDALAHYGKKGMKWGVRNDRKPSGGGSGKSSGKPKEDSDDAISKAIDQEFGKMTKAQLKAEGQAKLNAQAKNGDFPSKRQEKRDAKAESLTKRAGEFDKASKEMQDAADAITPGKNPWKRYERSVYRNQAELNAQQRDALLKKAEQVQAGKLTDGQKKLIIAGGLAAVAVAGAYGTHRWAEHKVGLNAASKKDLLEANKRESEKQWSELFPGEKHDFQPAASSFTASNGAFYAGLTNKKALSRPEFTIPEGTVFQRLSNHVEDSSEYGKIKGAYATFLSNDKKVYGSSSEFGSKKYTIGFEAQGPTKVPTIQTVLAHMKQIERSEGREPTDAGLMAKYHQMAGGSWSDSTSQKLFSSLRTYGYGAIVDDMDAGYLGDLPVVFFGAAKPATSTERGTVDRLKDQAAVMKLTRRYA